EVGRLADGDGVADFVAVDGVGELLLMAAIDLLGHHEFVFEDHHRLFGEDVRGYNRVCHLVALSRLMAQSFCDFRHLTYSAIDILEGSGDEPGAPEPTVSTGGGAELSFRGLGASSASMRPISRPC